MRCKIIITVFLTAIIVFLSHISFSQQIKTNSLPKLIQLGIISPDGSKAVYLMWPGTAEEFKKKWNVTEEEAGVPFLRAISWADLAQVAMASSNDLERTVVDLIARVDVLEKKVNELENKAK